MGICSSIGFRRFVLLHMRFVIRIAHERTSDYMRDRPPPAAVIRAAGPGPTRPISDVMVHLADQPKRPSVTLSVPLTRLERAMQEARARKDVF
jgi:hypothetical protein